MFTVILEIVGFCFGTTAFAVATLFADPSTLGTEWHDV